MCQNKLTQELYSQLDDFIKTHENKENELIGILHKAQDIFGYLPSEVQLHISRKLGIPAAKVNGVVTFYSYFTEKPKGEHVINICLGTACFVRGAEDILHEFEDKLKIKVGQTTPDGKHTIDGLRCVGACGLAPVVMIDGKVFGRVTKDQVPELLNSINE